MDNLWVLFIFSFQLYCPLRFQNSPQTRRWEGFLVFRNFSSFMTPSPDGVSIPNSFVSLFIFYILSFLLSKTMGCLSGCLVSSASIRKLFCGIYSAFKWSFFNEFVGEKLVSQSYSSSILWPPPPRPQGLILKDSEAFVLFLSSSLSWITHKRKLAIMSWAALLRKPTWQGIKTFFQQPWVRYLGNTPFSPDEAFKWLQPQ